MVIDFEETKIYNFIVIIERNCTHFAKTRINPWYGFPTKAAKVTKGKGTKKNEIGRIGRRGRMRQCEQECESESEQRSLRPGGARYRSSARAGNEERDAD